MAEAKAVRQGEEAEAFRRIADEKRLLAYQLADKWTGKSTVPWLVTQHHTPVGGPCVMCFAEAMWLSPLLEAFWCC